MPTPSPYLTPGRSINSTFSTSLGCNDWMSAVEASTSLILTCTAPMRELAAVMLSLMSSTLTLGNGNIIKKL